VPPDTVSDKDLNFYVTFECVLLLTLLVWYFIQQRQITAIILIAYQLISLLGNIYQLSQSSSDTTIGYLLLSIIFRVSAIILLSILSFDFKEIFQKTRNKITTQKKSTNNNKLSHQRINQQNSIEKKNIRIGSTFQKRLNNQV
jgi:hypothetical protein